MGLVRQLRVIKDQRTLFNKRYDEVRDRLLEVIEQEGIEDDKGHIILPLPEAVDGTTSLIRQRKATPSLDEDGLGEYLKEKGLYDQCLSTRVYLDRDKVSRLIYEEKLTEEEFAQFVSVKESWSLVEGK